MSAALAAFIALLFCGAVGLPLARRLFEDRSFALAAAPTIGWAMFSAAALPMLCVAGFDAVRVGALAVAALAVSGTVMRRDAVARDRAPDTPAIAYGLAAVLACATVAGLLPKETAEGVALAPPMFDHSKVAIINEIVRNGLPAQNPFYGEAGAPSGLSYYYLWHFGAAMLALLPGVSGWEADVGLTWFTAFATLALVMGLAVKVSGRASAAYWTLAVAAAGSGRQFLNAVFRQDLFGTWLNATSDLATELNQVIWAPQHVASAACVVISILLVLKLSESGGWLRSASLGLIAAAGFGSSVWVGGILFAIAAPVVGAFLVASPGVDRRRFILAALAAAAIAAIAASPILLAQFEAARVRNEGLPIALRPYETFGPWLVDSVWGPLRLLAYWLIHLPTDLPAVYPAGAVALVTAAFAGSALPEPRGLARVCALLVAISLVISWLLVSTVVNNDLGWRSILPAVLALMAFAGAGLARWSARPSSPMFLGAAVFLLVGAYGGVHLIVESATGQPSRSAAAFARSLEIWEAVRRHSGPTERIANNPMQFSDVTPWPSNISWALMSDRRSCFAAWEFVRPFAPLGLEEVARLNVQFQAAFGGAATAEETHDLFRTHECRLIVLTAADGVWTADPFAGDARYRLLDERRNEWRLYRLLDETAPKQ